MVSFGYSALDAEANYGGGTYSASKNRWNFDNVGLVYASKIGNKTPLRYVNFGFNYHKAKNFHRNMTMAGDLGGQSQLFQIAGLSDGLTPEYWNNGSIFDDNDTELAEPVAQNSKAWQDRFLSIKTKNYSPAVENFSMVFDVDTTALQPKSKFYQLIIDKNDIYSVFCLKQTLNSFDVKYSLTRSKDEAEIFLDTDNKLILEAIQKALTVYNINTQVKEIWL